MTRRSTGVGALLLACSLLAPACGDDDVNSGGASTTTTAADRTTTTAGEGGDGPSSTTSTTAAADERAAEEFCEAALEVDAALLGSELDRERVEAALTRLEETAPSELWDPVDVLVLTLRSAMRTGDSSAVLRAEFSAANLAVSEHLVADCGHAEMSLTAREYEYDGVPETLSPGPVALQLANEGIEFHEALVYRIDDAVTESAEELLALPYEEARPKLTSFGAAFSPPGQEAAVSLRLDEPGRYVVVCFLPVGFTPEAMQEMMASGTELDGPLHHTLGMIGEFTVE